MNTWTTGELDTVGEAEELQVASLRPDDTLWPFVIDEQAHKLTIRLLPR